MYARNPVRAVAGAAISLLSLLGSAHADWAPTKAVEFVVPFSPGGASDQMARVIQAAITKHELVKTPIVIQNKAGASGAEGILDVKSAAKDPHKVLVASTGIFTVPMATGLPFNWKDLTPVGMVAQDEFVLWVNAATPYQTAGDYLAEVKKAPGKLKMGGTRSKREDQVITAEVEHKAGVKFTYIPYKGGGEASTQLVGKHIDSNTNNPSESIAQWRAGQVRALCLFSDRRSGYTAKVTEAQSWADIPTCKEQGLDVSYNMLRGFFLPGGVTAEQTKFYADLLKKVVETPEFKEYLEKNALRPDFMVGQQFADFLAKDEARHAEIMKSAGFMAKK
jgi:tripartite-type tricarboxylate transporter receptor subunit TctC